LDIASVIPLLLDIIHKFVKNKISDKDLTKCIKQIESYLVRRSICDMNTNTISRVAQSIIKKINENSLENGIYNHLFQYLIKDKEQSGNMMPSNTYMQKEMLSINFYNNKHAKDILLKMENYKNNVRIDKISIEHIMPQEPTEYWTQRIYLEEGDVVNEVYNMLVNNIGNLILLNQSRNSSASNLDFEHKKSIYRKDSHLILNTEVLESKEWNSDKIKDRTREMVSLICEIWKFKF
jgi:Protein of unknown function (DUF1524)